MVKFKDLLNEKSYNILLDIESTLHSIEAVSIMDNVCFGWQYVQDNGIDPPDDIHI